jgi:hypothetical protein
MEDNTKKLYVRTEPYPIEAHHSFHLSNNEEYGQLINQLLNNEKYEQVIERLIAETENQKRRIEKINIMFSKAQALQKELTSIGKTPSNKNIKQITACKQKKEALNKEVNEFLQCHPKKKLTIIDEYKKLSRLLGTINNNCSRKEKLIISQKNIQQHNEQKNAIEITKEKNKQACRQEKSALELRRNAIKTIMKHYKVQNPNQLIDALEDACDELNCNIIKRTIGKGCILYNSCAQTLSFFPDKNDAPSGSDLSDEDSDDNYPYFCEECAPFFKQHSNY